MTTMIVVTRIVTTNSNNYLKVNVNIKSNQIKFICDTKYRHQ